MTYSGHDGQVDTGLVDWNCSGVCFQPLQLAASNPAAAHVSLWNLFLERVKEENRAVRTLRGARHR